MKKEEETWEEAVGRCKKILQKFLPNNKRATLFIGFHVWSEYNNCPFVDHPETALGIAEDEDRRVAFHSSSTTIPLLREIKNKK